jgi:hypothetical protein
MSDIAKWNGIAIAGIAKINGIAVGSIAKYNGVTWPSASEDWLTGWTYRKSVTLSRASGAVTNYQMKLLVGESSGATGEDVDCGALCKTDFSDLRFTKADGVTLLDYWIESISGTTPNQLATIWIEFDSIGTDATTFYMYYGNSAAAAVSNGVNTFILFDHFAGESLDAKWTAVDSGTGSRSFSGSVMTQATTATGGNYKIHPTNNSFSRVSIECLFRTNDARRSLEDLGMAKDGNNIVQGVYYDIVPTKKLLTSAYYSSTWHDSDLETGGSAVWRIGTVQNGGSNTICYLYDVTRAPMGTKSWALDLGASVTMNDIGTRWVSANTSLEIDWIFIRQYLATEPTFGAFGAQETA